MFRRRGFRGSTSRTSALHTWQWILGQVAEQRRGTLTASSLHRVTCILPEGEIDAQVHGRSHSHLRMRIRKSFPLSISFFRLPRLISAFMEAFVKPEKRVEQLPYFIVTDSAEALADLKKSHSFVTSLQKLSDYGFSIHVDRSGVTLKKRVWNTELENLPYLEILRLVEDFADVCAAPLAEIPLQEIASEQHCAYCKESIGDGAPVTLCSLCKTPHHRECFDLNGGCSVFGCRSHQRIEPPLVASRL